MLKRLKEPSLPANMCFCKLAETGVRGVLNSIGLLMLMVKLKTVVEENFEVVKVNYDPKNKNEDLLAKLEFPQRFGFPVFVILDGKR